MKYASFEDIEKIHAKLHETHDKGTCLPLEYRRRQLYQLALLLKENAGEIAEAINKDIRKPKLECLNSEILAGITRTLHAFANLEEWMKPDKPANVPEMQKSWNHTTYKVPLGPVVVLGPWNFPIGIVTPGLISAIAAGCPAVIKPSELTPNASSLFEALVKKYLDNSAYVVVNGAIPETTKILELKWAHILLTGSQRVAKIVATAAAKHLTPVTLELGGKVPVVVDPDYDLKLLAKRVLWGKHIAAGTTCLTPDYILVTKDKRSELLRHLKEAFDQFYPDGGLNSQSYSSIINEQHFTRLTDLMKRSKGKVEFGGRTDKKNLKMEIAVVTDVDENDSLMEEELFGPILPIVTVTNFEEALAFVKARPGALAMSVFTDKEEIKQRIVTEVTSGMVVFNDCLMLSQVNEMPFSGIGTSGYGYQVGYLGYLNFTHLKSTIEIPKELEPFLGFRYPPYAEESVKATENMIAHSLDTIALN